MYETYARLRDSKGLKDSDVSKCTGIGQGVFSDWKKGRYTPKTDKLQKIADCLGVSLDYLSTGHNYYYSDETAAKAQELFENPSMRILFDAARGSKPEDLQMAADLLSRLKETNPDG